MDEHSQDEQHEQVLQHETIDLPTAPPESEATPGAVSHPAPKKVRRRAGFDPQVKKELTAAVRKAKKADRDAARKEGVQAVKRAKRKHEPQFEEAKGNPEWEPTETDQAQIMALAGFGMTLEETGIILGLSEQTLVTHKAKIETMRGKGLSIAKSRVRQAGYEQAVGGSLGHWRFFEERVLGYTPKTTSELTGAAGGPIESTTTTTVVQLSDDDLVARFRTLVDRTASVTAVSAARYTQAPEAPVEPL